MESYSPRFLSGQAQRTAPTRKFFYKQLDWSMVPLILDLGCGTGIITLELARQESKSHVIGLDIDATILRHAIKTNDHHLSLHYLLADARAIPLRTECATFILCHFTLMWISNRTPALKEVYRILHSNGIFAAIEPDYAGRIESPKQPSSSSRSLSYPIIQYLIKEGADPFTGGQLPHELQRHNFKKIQFGVLAWQYNSLAAHAELQEEANLLRANKLRWIIPEYAYTPIWWIMGTK